MLVIMKNIHTGDVVTVELIEQIFTWQKTYKVRLASGEVTTATASQGWYIVKS